MISIASVNAACALISTLAHPSTVASSLPGWSGHTEDSSPGSGSDSWSFDAFIYYWSANVSGNVTVDGDDIDLDGGGGDGFTGETALSGFLGDFEAHHGPWTFALAPVLANVEATGTESGGPHAVVKISAQLPEAFVAHSIGSSWEWLAGARYYGLETDVDLSVGGVPAGSFGNEHSWVDPIVGARYHDNLGESWFVRARADVGGFGIGSDFAWNASAFVGYRFSSWCMAQFGYRAMHLDLESGSGSDRVAYDLTLNGPILGVSFFF